MKTRNLWMKMRDLGRRIHAAVIDKVVDQVNAKLAGRLAGDLVQGIITDEVTDEVARNADAMRAEMWPAGTLHPDEMNRR